MKLKSGYIGVIQFHALFSLAITALLWLTTEAGRTKSFCAGAAVISANWWLLGFGWRHLEGKKSIALAPALIVIKYPILAVVCFICLQQEWFLLGWFAAGIATVIPAGFWAALTVRKIKN